MSSPSRRNRQTRSSFAQSFFQSGSSDEGEDVEDVGAENDRKPTALDSKLRARRSSSLSNDAAEAAAQSVAQMFDGDDSRSSWYQDALRQGGSASEIQELLGDVSIGAIDKEVLEQYRVMAQIEARERVKQNIGFDLDEYQATHKLACEETTDKRALFGVSSKKQRHRLPEQKRPSPESTKLHTEVPPLLPPCPDRKLVEQKCKRAPDLMEGTVGRSDGTLPRGDHKVKCLACRCSLQVNQMATLVKCPECNVISPATSTRR